MAKSNGAHDAKSPANRRARTALRAVDLCQANRPPCLSHYFWQHYLILQTHSPEALPVELPPLVDPLLVSGRVVLPLASPALPFLMAPGGSAFSVPEPAFISVDGGIPPLSTGASLPEDCENATPEPIDNRLATARANTLDLIMDVSFYPLHTLSLAAVHRQGCHSFDRRSRARGRSARLAGCVLTSDVRIVRIDFDIRIRALEVIVGDLFDTGLVIGRAADRDSGNR